ncbi:diguanylate cyclase [Salinispira pacifica]
MKLVVLIVSAWCILPVTSASAGPGEPISEWSRIDGPWYYSWTDSTPGRTAPVQWNRINHPSNPSDRNGRSEVVFRTYLPDTLPADATLFIPSADTSVSVLVDGNPVYSFGLPRGRFDHRFHGWPWHMVPLPAEASGAAVDFHVYSDYRDIGLWGDIMIGSRNAIFLHLAARDAPRLLVAAALLTIALLGLLVFLFGKPRHAYVYMATITLLMTIRVIADTYLKQLFVPSPLLWEYIEATTSYLIPGFVSLFLVDIVRKPFDRMMRWAGIVYVATGAVGVILSLTGLFPVYSLYTPSELMFALFVLLFVAATAASLRHGSRESAILLSTFLVMAALNIHDILVARSLIPWTDTTEHYMILFFAAGIATVVAMRISAMHRDMGNHASELAALNSSLEETVQHRTRELEEANRLLAREKEQLEIASNTDELTQLYNRRYLHLTLERELRAAHRYGHALSIVMLDLDFFKLLNDTYGHVEGDAVLKIIAATIRGELRDIDYAARYGGEEFLVVLPQTDISGALRVAERIRLAVEGNDWESGRETTISAGVAAQMPGSASLSINELVHAADEALYRAKAGGRNRVSL